MPTSPMPRAADKIRASARDLFYHQGIRAVGVDEIVSQAGVTKPSLYRAYGSKDELAAAYLTDWAEGFWERLEAAVAAHPDDPRAQLSGYFAGLAQRATKPGWRGCALSNAAVEYPGAGHPVRQVAEAHKREVRARLAQICAAAGAPEPDKLGDSLMLLLEGVFVSVQLFGADGPGGVVAEAADALIDSALARRA